ncbi:hypothetical protein VRU48_08105 [Pedobacter sp. KR3-3]|uniref:Uncharacterized protein n=1 Tax=Pedobacter albus TaxID=3113905 RepID=A0ABU7I6U8_9SPHI|nr:hypothetical protein [Pedobacter sp. KR3-3]MEE1945066.1 hypothetical protein [Pedobacter sp. KR3-3]
MEELKKHLKECKKVTVKEYTSLSTGEIRLYIQFHFARGAKELSISYSEEAEQMLNNYLMGKPLE